MPESITGWSRKRRTETRETARNTVMNLMKDKGKSALNQRGKEVSEKNKERLGMEQVARENPNQGIKERHK